MGLGIPEGFFFLDKPGMPLPIELRLEDDDHLERAEQFMQRAEAAVAARFNEAPLPGFTDNRELCLRCPHRGKSCAPPLDFGEGAVIITDERLIAAAYTHEATKADYDAYQDAHKILSKALRGVMLGTLGPYEIQGKWQSQTEYQLPADIEEAIDKIKEPFALLNPQGKYRFRLVRIDAKAEDGE